MSPGFTDPPRQAQRAFRAILDALAHPTRAYAIEGPAAPPAPLRAAMAAIALTLCDEDTPLWLDDTLASDEVVTWLAFHTGTRPCRHTDRAGFLFATAYDYLPPWDQLAIGTHEQPHQSATIVLDATGASGQSRFEATGPGIDGSARLTARWAPADFEAVWRRNTDRFPTGVDLLIVDGATVTGLPRTTQLTQAPGERGDR